MRKKPKAEECEPGTAGEKTSEDTVEKDQIEHRYYYDDALGYEAFDPAEEDDEDREAS